MKSIICSLSRGIQTVTLLLACTTYSMSTFAQSVEDCMSARQATATSVCQSVLASGSRSVDVYWKLTSAQFQDGQQEEANKTLDDALKLHPGNKRLLALREIISAVETEKALIIRSAKVDQSFVNKGAAKIACLTKTGTVAIQACQQRLEMTNDDGDRIRARLALLESQQPATTIASTPAPTTPTAIATAPTTEPSVPTVVAGPTAEQLAAEERKQAYKSLVADVQTQLNAFGFNTGFPDGVAGGKTRSALTEFYTTLGVPAETTITDATLEDLTREKSKLASAQQLLRQSERTIEQGNAQLASQQLANARNTSLFLEVPVSLEQTIRTTQIATATVIAPIVPPTPTQVPTVTQPAAVAQLPSVTQPTAVAQLPTVTQPATVAQRPTVTQPTAVAQLPTVTQPAAVAQSPTVTQLPAVTQPTVVTQQPIVTQPTVVAQLPTVTQPAVVAQNPTVTKTPAIVQTTTDNAQQFAQLMGQINILHKQIRRKQTDQVEHLDRMRNVL